MICPPDCTRIWSTVTFEVFVTVWPDRMRMTAGVLEFVGGLVAVNQEVPLLVCHVAALVQLPLCTVRKSPMPWEITTLVEVPVAAFSSVAVIVMVSARLSIVLMVKVPLERVLALSANIPSALLSKTALPLLLVIVTTVLLSLVTVWFAASCATTVVVKGPPFVCVAET